VQGGLREPRRNVGKTFWNDPTNAALSRDLTRDYNLTADLLVRASHPHGVLEMYRHALLLSTEVLAVQASSTSWRIDQHARAKGHVWIA